MACRNSGLALSHRTCSSSQSPALMYIVSPALACPAVPAIVRQGFRGVLPWFLSPPEGET